MSGLTVNLMETQVLFCVLAFLRLITVIMAVIYGYFQKYT